MNAKLTTKQIVSKVKRTIAKDNECLVSDLLEDYGYRYRVTKECAQYGDDVIEVASTYYYQSQARVEGRADDFEMYAHNAGIELVLTAVNDHTRYNDAPWPKTSWATKFYHVRVID